MSSRKLFCLSLAAVFFLLSFHTCTGNNTRGVQGEVSYESQIISELKKDYIKEARPVQNANQTVSVSVGIFFVGVEDVNEAANTFTATLVLVQKWKDPRLKWNPPGHGGVQIIRLAASDLWKPDIVPHNTAPHLSLDTLYDDTAMVKNDGSVEWLPMVTVSFKCPMDLSDFPYDTQTCRMVFGSWTHSTREMTMRFLVSNVSETEISMVNEGDAFLASGHPEWKVVDNKAKAKIQNIKYSCCDDSFTLLSITCQLKRKSNFYRCLAVGPAAVIGFLVPLVFLLPSSSQEKTMFGMFIILTLTVLMLVLEETVPFNHGSVPQLGVFYLVTMVFTSINVILSVVISNLSVRGSRRQSLPSWLHRMFLSRNGLRRFFCIGQYSPVDNICSCSSIKNIADDRYPEPEVPVKKMDAVNQSQIDIILKDIRNSLRFIVEKASAGDSHKKVNQDWEEFARVLDRILFVLFFALYVLTSLALLT